MAWIPIKSLTTQLYEYNPSTHLPFLSLYNLYLDTFPINILSHPYSWNSKYTGWSLEKPDTFYFLQNFFLAPRIIRKICAFWKIKGNNILKQLRKFHLNILSRVGTLFADLEKVFFFFLHFLKKSF